MIGEVDVALEFFVIIDVFSEIIRALYKVPLQTGNYQEIFPCIQYCNLGFEVGTS